MPSKTISLRLEAYERLRRARRHQGESFSDVVMRARWDDVGATAADLLDFLDRRGPVLSEEALDRIDEAKELDRPPPDKWGAP